MICFRKGFEPEDLLKPTTSRFRGSKSLIPINKSALEFLLEFSESADRLRKWPCEEYGDVAEFYAVLCFEELRAIQSMAGHISEEVGERYLSLCYDCLQSLSKIGDRTQSQEVIFGYIESISDKARIVEEMVA